MIDAEIRQGPRDLGPSIERTAIYAREAKSGALPGKTCRHERFARNGDAATIALTEAAANLGGQEAPYPWIPKIARRRPK